MNSFKNLQINQKKIKINPIKILKKLLIFLSQEDRLNNNLTIIKIKKTLISQIDKL